VAGVRVHYGRVLRLLLDAVGDGSTVQLNIPPVNRNTELKGVLAGHGWEIVLHVAENATAAETERAQRDSEKSNGLHDKTSFLFVAGLPIWA